jgi:hypothetical protein
MLTPSSRGLLAAALLARAAALPYGFGTFFLNGCPEGWVEIPEAQGRLVVSVVDPTVAGLTVNDPLGDQENREHQHPYSGNFTLPSKNIAALDCCDTDGANNGDFPFSGTTNAAASGLPFTQLWLCRVAGTNETSYAPYGAVGFYDPSVTACPEEWAPYVAGAGRALIPGYIPTGGEPVPSVDPPLASLEDRGHSHAFAAEVLVPDISYVGIDGCCNENPAPSGSLPVSAVTDVTSAGVPYVQLLTCFSQNTTFNTSLPSGALLFSPLLGCMPGWELASFVSGRYLVALPQNGLPGADFGGGSLPPNATSDVGTTHDVSGSVALPADDVGLGSGCCADGYAAATGSAPFTATTTADSAQFPYLMMAVCVQESDAAAWAERKVTRAAQA